MKQFYNSACWNYTSNQHYIYAGNCNLSVYDNDLLQQEMCKAGTIMTNEAVYYDYICEFKCMSTALHNQYTPKTSALEKYTGITYIFTYFISANTQYRALQAYSNCKICKN